MSRDGTVIVGGGLAAQRCAETLRARGYSDPIRIVCAEPEAPYDRPPLSKGLLAGDLDADDVRLRGPGWHDDNAVELILGRRATALRPERRVVELDHTDALPYDDLVIATGASARSLPQLTGFANALSLRTLADAGRLRTELAPGSSLVIIGAGFIGLEVAATAVALGAEVTIVEALDLPLAGVLGPDVGRWLVRMHRDEGVRILLSARLAGASGNGRVERLELEDGRGLDCDVVVVGVGVAPATDWLRGTELDATGVLTDAGGRTGLPHVYAAGDVARPFDPRIAEHARTEHWDAASRQGAAVAQSILGGPPRPTPLPSFWSDQFGSRIQLVGHASGVHEARLSGDPDDRDFSVLYMRDGRPAAGLAVGRPRELAAMRRLIEKSNPQTKETTR